MRRRKKHKSSLSGRTTKRGKLLRKKKKNLVKGKNGRKKPRKNINHKGLVGGGGVPDLDGSTTKNHYTVPHNIP